MTPTFPLYRVALRFPWDDGAIAIVAGMRWVSLAYQGGQMPGLGEWEYLIAVVRGDETLSGRGWHPESDMGRFLDQPAPERIE